MADPTCLINGSPTPADVSASATVNGALANPGSGIKVWTLAVTSCDGQNTVAAIQATLVVNQSAKTFQFTAPSSLGSCVIFQSAVQDASGAIISTTFKVNVKTAHSLRVIAPNEQGEQDPVNGWVESVNAAIRLAGSGSGGSGGGQFNTTLSNGVNHNVSTGGAIPGGTIVLRVGGPTAAFSIDGVSVTGLADGTEAVIWNTTTQQMTIVDASSSASSAANQIYTVRGTPVNPVVRGGSLCRLTKDKSLNGGVGGWVLSGSGYSEPDRYDIRDFGADEAKNDNSPSIQSAINAAIADLFCRRVFVPRLIGNSQSVFRLGSPLKALPTNVVYIEFENPQTVLRIPSWVGPALVVCAPATSNPNLVQDGSSGFWGIQFSGVVTSDPILYFTACDLANLNQPTFTYETWIKIGSASSAFLFSSNGQRRVTDAPTTAFAVSISSSNHVSVTYTTSGSGKQTLTSTATIPNDGARHKVSFTFGQGGSDANPFMRIHIGGVFDSKQSASGTLVQGFEDAIFGNQSGSWPYGSPLFNTPTCTVYQTRLSFNGASGGGSTGPGARYAFDTNYTPETTPFAHTDAQTMLLLDFNPTYLDTTCNLHQFRTQYSSLGLNQDTPVWVKWAYENEPLGGSATIRNFGLVNAVGGHGILAVETPELLIDTPNIIGGGFPITLYGNTFGSSIRGKGVILAGNALAGSGPPPPANWSLAILQAASIMDIQGLKFANGHCSYGFVGVEVAGRFADCWFLTNGNGSIFCKSIGSASEYLFDNCYLADETTTYTDHTALFSAIDTAATPSELSINCTTHGGTWQQTKSSGIPIAEIDGGGQYLFGHPAWPGNTTVNPVYIRNQPRKPVVITNAGQILLGSGAEVAWMPETGNAGQGRIILPSCETASVAITWADADGKLPMLDYVFGTWVFGGTLTADRHVWLPLGPAGGQYFGIERTVVNNTNHNLIFQGSTNGTSGSGTSITVASGTTVKIAGRDGSNWTHVVYS